MSWVRPLAPRQVWQEPWQVPRLALRLCQAAGLTWEQLLARMVLMPATLVLLPVLLPGLGQQKPPTLLPLLLAIPLQPLPAQLFPAPVLHSPLQLQAERHHLGVHQLAPRLAMRHLPQNPMSCVRRLAQHQG
jgi:hypothetical protein